MFLRGLFILGWNTAFFKQRQTQKQTQSEYKTENKKIVLESIIPCYKELIDELNKLKGTGTNEGGICNFPSGKKYYEYLVSSETGSNKDNPPILKIDTKN